MAHKNLLLPHRNALKDHIIVDTGEALAAHGDSTELLKLIPDHSVSLIFTDPPYHATKKRNIHGDTAFRSDEEYLAWLQTLAVEWKRILKPNGSLYCFCDSSMAARIEVMFSSLYNVLSHIVWTKPNEPGFDGWKGKMKKEALRQWYPHSERIIFAEPAMPGNLHRSNFADFLKRIRKQAGLSTYELTAAIGAHGKVNHGGAVSNWEAGRNTPSRDQYSKMKDALLATGRVDKMPEYQDVIRPFFMDGNKEFTDVWTFPSVRPYPGKHPAEKPLDLITHAIEASTYDGDVVLDPFAGSGSTLVAAARLGRKAVGIEIDPLWAEMVKSSLAGVARNTDHKLQRAAAIRDTKAKHKSGNEQLGLL